MKTTQADLTLGELLTEDTEEGDRLLNAILKEVTSSPLSRRQARRFLDNVGQRKLLSIAYKTEGYPKKKTHSAFVTLTPDLEGNGEIFSTICHYMTPTDALKLGHDLILSAKKAMGSKIRRGKSPRKTNN